MRQGLPCRLVFCRFFSFLFSLSCFRFSRNLLAASLDADLAAHGVVAFAKIFVVAGTIEGKTGCGTLAGKRETYRSIPIFRCAQSDSVLDLILIDPSHRGAGFDLQSPWLILKELNHDDRSGLGTWAHALIAHRRDALSRTRIVTFLVCAQCRTSSQDHCRHDCKTPPKPLHHASSLSYCYRSNRLAFLKRSTVEQRDLD